MCRPRVAVDSDGPLSRTVPSPSKSGAQAPLSGARQAPPQAPTNQQPSVTFPRGNELRRGSRDRDRSDGAFVKDLEQGDFEIYEDGRLQSPTVFSMVDLGIERPFTPVNAAGPMDGCSRDDRTFDGRHLHFLLDDLHTYVTLTNNLRELVKRFIDQYLGADDLAAVVFTSGRQESGQELTGSRQLLKAAVDRFQGQKLPSAGAESWPFICGSLPTKSIPIPGNDAGGPHGGRASACAVGS